MLETFKSMLLELGPYPGFSLASEEVEGGDDVGEVWNEFPVEIGESSERPNSLD